MGPQMVLIWASVVEKVLSVLARFRFKSKKRTVQVEDIKEKKLEPPA